MKRLSREIYQSTVLQMCDNDQITKCVLFTNVEFLLQSEYSHAPKSKTTSELYPQYAFQSSSILPIKDLNFHFKNLYSAGLMGFTANEIAHFHRSIQRPGGSPTDELLTTWDYENHTIEELYQKLFEMRHVRCMELLKDLGGYHWIMLRFYFILLINYALL